MNPDVTESPESLAETVVGHLLDLIAGRFTVTPTGVQQYAGSSPRRQILAAFMELHQELRAREEAYDEAIGELQRTLESLQDRHQQLMHNQALTNELSTPIIKAGPHILMMPLIGEIDSARSLLILERLLYATKEVKARYLILDITGVSTINRSVAGYFVRFVQALKLLGARTLLAGVGPEVAKRLAEEGQEVATLRCVPDVEAALEQCRQAESRRLRQNVLSR